MYTSIAGDTTVTGAGNCAVSALPCLETQPPSGLHRAAGDPRHPSLTGIQGPLLGQFGVGRPFRLARFCGRDQVGRGAGVKAVVYDRYGSPDVLRVEEVPVPSPAAGQVRVKIAATSVNLSDWECLRGSPAYARIGGLRFPARRTLGSDIAGLVDDVGEGVTRFRPGDEVYGDNLALKGGFAEYALAPESALAHKPAQLTFAEASTIPQAGAIALQGTQAGRDGSPGADQRRWRRVGILRDSAGQAARCSRHRCRQRRQAGLHAVGRRGRRDRLPPRRLHPDHPAVRPDPGPGRAPVGVRLPACAGTRRHVSVRGWVGAHAAARAHRRLGWWGGSPVAQSGCLPSRRGRPTSSRLPTSALPGRSGSTSTAPSRSTRFPPRLLMSVRDAHLGKVVVVLS